MWKEITGYMFRYRISDQGIVQKHNTKTKQWITLVPVLKNHAAVRLRRKDGTYHEASLPALMDWMFRGGYAKKNGLYQIHKNGSKLDCSLENLMPLHPKEVGKMFSGRGSRKPVIRTGKDGESVVYPSITEAARKNGITTSVLYAQLYKNRTDPRGYRWEVDRG